MNATCGEVRAAIFVDAEYFRIACMGRDGCGALASTQLLIEFIQSHVGGCEDIRRWRCFAYDAKYAGKAEASVHPSERAMRKRLHSTLHGAGFTMRFGSYVLRDIRVVGDVKSTRIIVQKEVDTMIVVDAMREAFTVGTDTLVFVTGDADFIPLFRELRVRKKRVVLLHGDENTVSAQLAKTASVAHTLMPHTKKSCVQSRLQVAR